MIKTEIDLNDFGGYKWHDNQGVKIVGPLSALEEASLAAALSSDGFDENALRMVLDEMRTFFSAIAQFRDTVVLVADHLGGFPLYYSIVDGVLRVSDDAKKCSISRMPDELALAEYTTSFVTIGDRTLWEDVKEVEAGTFVLIGADGSSKVTRYWLGKHSFSDQDASLEDVADIAGNVFGDIMNRFGDSPIVLPLTSGTDSRMNAIMLKEMGHNNIRAFSMGFADDDDVVVGRQIAEALGFPWVHVDLNESNVFHSVMNSPEYSDILLYAARGGRCSHFRMYCALKVLEEMGCIPDDAVFMPGHCGMVEGGEMRRTPYFKNGLSREKAASVIRVFESRIADSNQDMAHAIECEYVSRMQEGDHLSFEAFSGELDDVHLHDYGVKFCANDIRNYEFCGYRWYTPLMEKRWCDFWLHRSYYDSAGKRLEITFENKMMERYGIRVGYYPQHSPIRAAGLKTNTTVKSILTKLLWWKRSFPDLDACPAFFAELDDVRVQNIAKKYLKLELMNRMLAERTLEELYAEGDLLRGSGYGNFFDN